MTRDISQNVHCIGDRANHIVLNAMEKALLKLPKHERAARRLRLEHAQIMTLTDLDRAAKLGSECACRNRGFGDADRLL